MTKHYLYSTCESVQITRELRTQGMFITACDQTLIFEKEDPETWLEYFAQGDEEVTCDYCIMSLLGEV